MAVSVFVIAFGVNEGRNDSFVTDLVIEDVGIDLCGWTETLDDVGKLDGSDAVFRCITIISHYTINIDGLVWCGHLWHYLTINIIGVSVRAENDSV